MFTLLLLSTVSFASSDQTLFGPKRYDLQKGKPTAYTDSFAGCTASEQAALKVINGDSRWTRVTSARIYINGITVASERDFQRNVPSFKKTITIHKTNEVKVILKGGHRRYHQWLGEYLERKGDPGDEPSKIQGLRKQIEQSGNKAGSREIDRLLREFQEIGRACDERDSVLIKLDRSLDDDFDDDDGNDDETDDALDSNWLPGQRAAFESQRKEIEKVYDDCKRFRDAHDRAKPKYRDYEYDTKREALYSLCDFLDALAEAVKRSSRRLAEIAEKIERWKKEPAFIIIEMVGRICDEAAPVLSNPQPPDGSILTGAMPTISVQYADGVAGAGIDTASVRMILDGRDVTSSVVTDTGVSYTPAENLTDGQHAATVNVFDKVHNQASLTWGFTIRTIVTVVKITSHQNNQYLNTPVITVSGSITNPEAAVTVNGSTAEVSENSFSLSGVALAEGPNTITAEARDAVGNLSSDSVVIHLDTAAPVVRVTAPAPDAYVNTPTVTVVGYVNEPVTSVTVNGAAAEVVGMNFSLYGVQLVEGTNTVAAEARDQAGNIGMTAATIHLDREIPVIKISAPVENAYVNTPIIDVVGTVSESVLSVKINGIPAQVTENGFSLAGLNLAEGINIITVEALDSAGNTATAGITVTLDTHPPVVQITSPLANIYLNKSAIAVNGTLSEPVTSVTINGIAASFTDTGFSLSSLSLVEGPNAVTVEVKDQAGNTGTASMTVHLDTLPPVVNVTAPQANAYLNTPAVPVIGTIDEPAASVTINGAAAVVTDTGFAIDSLNLAEGLNVITVEATDRAGNTATANISVNLDTLPPAVNVTAPQADAYLNTQVIAVTGTVNETVASVTVNGAAAAITGNGFSLGSLTLAEGANAIVIEAKDQAGNIGTVAITVHLDREQPVIQMTSSAQVAYVNTPIFTVAGTVNEPVTSVTVNGVSAEVAGTNFSLPGVGLVEGANTLTVETIDRAGNIGTATVTIHLDTAPPVIRITAPATGAFVNAPVIAVAGTLSEPECKVMVNGALAQATGTNFNLTGLALAEGPNTITASATDRAGNTGAANVSITLDTSPPVISLNAPALAAAGANVSIAVSASDNSGLALCELFVNHAPVWTFAADSQPGAANAIAYSLSPDLAPGTMLNLTARAYDIAGNLGEASAQITISQGPSGPGYLQGQVYDDTKGLRLDGVSAGIHDANGQLLTQLTTQADGRYFYQTPGGAYLIRLAKEGFTAVERLIAVRPEKTAAATDARLTPVSMAPSLIGAAGGRIVAGSGLELTVPAGALDQPVDIRVTPISNQGLAGLLPTGWSPIAAVDIRIPGAAATFLQPASLKIPLTGFVALAPSSTVPLAMYDASMHQWVVQGTATVSADGAYLTAPIPFLGQYAVVLPDHGLTPPALVAGQPLPPFSVTSATDGISAAGKVVPPAAPPAAGLRAVGEVIVINETSPLHSGLLINGRVTERFDLLTGETVAPSEYIQDMILYQYPCVTNIAPASTGSTLNTDLDAMNTGKVGTSFPITPSRECTILDLLAGKVSIEISLPPTEAKGVMAGAEGARISDAEGNILVIPQNALSQTVPVELKTIEPSLVSGLVGSDFTLLRAVGINLANRALAQTAEISIPVLPGLEPAYPIVVAKLIDVRGAGRLRLVALANVSGSLITSLSFPAGGGSSGITRSGSYFFIQARAALGFVKGLVTDAGANPYPSALVTSNTCSLVDLTGVDGNYLTASTVSAFTVRATDIYKYDEGEGEGLLAAGGQTAIVNLTIRMIPPRVDGVVFTDSGRGIEPNTSISVTFNKALDKTTVTGENIILKDASGNRISGSFSINPEGSVVTFYPATFLVSQASYTLTVSKNIKDLQGYLMGQDVVRPFTVRNTTPPPMPPAGSIVGSFPDENGLVTVTATQGSADATNTVLILNDSTGEMVSVTPATNGSFTGRIFAMLGDEIKILLMDNAGNQTLISYIAMKSPDGRYLVTTKGGTVEGEGGTRLDIPDGALLGPAIVKITPVAEASLPPLPPEARFLAAVNIDAGGAKFLKPLKLSVPAPANAGRSPRGAGPLSASPRSSSTPTEQKSRSMSLPTAPRSSTGDLRRQALPSAGSCSAATGSSNFPILTWRLSPDTPTAI